LHRSANLLHRSFGMVADKFGVSWIVIAGTGRKMRQIFVNLR
jgi:predicted 3-demethylubiquinone-9 3-methyltransferase (glyoxalase superfamily)